MTFDLSAVVTRHRHPRAEFKMTFENVRAKTLNQTSNLCFFMPSLRKTHSFSLSARKNMVYLIKTSKFMVQNLSGEQQKGQEESGLEDARCSLQSEASRTLPLPRGPSPAALHGRPRHARHCLLRSADPWVVAVQNGVGGVDLISVCLCVLACERPRENKR